MLGAVGVKLDVLGPLPEAVFHDERLGSEPLGVGNKLGFDFAHAVPEDGQVGNARRFGQRALFAFEALDGVAGHFPARIAGCRKGLAGRQTTLGG
jgi:hypothetical protein